MRKSIVLLCSIAVLLVSALLLPFKASAERVVLEDNERISEVFAHCVEYSGQSGSNLIGVDCYYASGHHKNNPDFIACELYVGGTVYGYSINYAAATPAHNSWTVAGYPTFGAHWLKLGNYQFWYNAGSSSAATYQLDAFCSNHAEFYNTVSNGVSNYDMTYNINVTYMDTSGSDGSSPTVQDFADSVTADVSPDPTEPETEAPAVDSSAEPFTLPQEWIDGGETLAAGEAATFDGVDPDGALSIMETLNPELDEGTLAGVSAFWYILTSTISALNIWNIVYIILLLGVITWFMGRKT